MEQGHTNWITNYIWEIADILALEQETEGLLGEIVEEAH